MQKLSVIFLILLLICQARCKEPAWQADFSVPGPLQWKTIRENSGDLLTVRDKELEIICTPAPYKGKQQQTSLPALPRGKFSFEVMLNADNAPASAYNHFSLYLRFADLLISFKPEYWYRHHARLGTKILARHIPEGQWLKCMLFFDISAGTVLYYCGDMEQPVHADRNLKLSTPLSFTVGNYGIAAGRIRHRLRNVRLEAADAIPVQTAAPRKGIQVFRGVDFNSYDLPGLCRRIAPSVTPEIFTVNINLGLLPENNFCLEKEPLFSLKHPALVILADMPLNGTLSRASQEELVKEVEAGTVLLILGGFFTLNKGEFSGSPLASLLPVIPGSPWAVQRFAGPEKHPAGGLLQYMQLCSLHAEASSVCDLDGRPLIAVRHYGRGLVVVSTAIPAGRLYMTRQIFSHTDSFYHFLTNLIHKHGGIAHARQN